MCFLNYLVANRQSQMRAKAMQKEEIKIYWLVLILAAVGFLVGLGKLLQSKEKITARLFFGRSIVSSMLSLSVLAALHVFPEMSVEVLLGLSVVIGVMGEQWFEVILNRFLKDGGKIK